MKNKIVVNILLSMLIMSFNVKPPKNLQLIKGTYGICEANSSLQLVINEDNTFHYINNTNSKSPIDVKGSWELIENTIYLKNYRSDVAINKEWKIDKSYPCLKSRKGLEFTRLCLLSK